MDLALSIVEINETVLFTKRYKVNTSERAQQDETLNRAAKCERGYKSYNPFHYR